MRWMLVGQREGGREGQKREGRTISKASDKIKTKKTEGGLSLCCGPLTTFICFHGCICVWLSRKMEVD